LNRTAEHGWRRRAADLQNRSRYACSIADFAAITNFSRYLGRSLLPSCRSFQIVVELLEISTGVVDEPELHGFEQRRSVGDLVIAPSLDSQEEIVEAFGGRILKVFELSTGILPNITVSQSRREGVPFG
jgi:hypothetical protein